MQLHYRTAIKFSTLTADLLIQFEFRFEFSFFFWALHVINKFSVFAEFTVEAQNAKFNLSLSSNGVVNTWKTTLKREDSDETILNRSSNARILMRTFNRKKSRVTFTRLSKMGNSTFETFCWNEITILIKI